MAAKSETKIDKQIKPKTKNGRNKEPQIGLGAEYTAMMQKWRLESEQKDKAPNHWGVAHWGPC